MTKANKYFYAHQDVDLYDKTIGLTVPQYELIHQTLAEVVRAHYAGTDINGLKLLTCDLGAGTGKESQVLLDLLPASSLVAVDISEPMRSTFESRMVSHYGTLDRVRFMVKDMLDEDLPSILLKQAEAFEKGRYDLVVSAYCIHHFSLEDKRKVYQLMYELLAPGGLMVNLDLFSFESAKVSKQAHDFDLTYIAQSFEAPPVELLSTPGMTKERLDRMCADWLEHMERDNVLHSAVAQIGMMQDIGYTNCECVFRYWQQGLLRAEKPD